VALTARLAPAVAGQPPAPLRLRSGSGLLTLVDAAGRRFQAPELVLHWRWQPLAEPRLWQRQVLGPFASFESAEAAALGWRSLGVQAVIARPAEWEVWAPLSAPAPAGGPQPRRQEIRQVGRWQPELRRTQGPELLQGPIRLEAPGGLRWQKGVFAGPFRLQGDAYGSWTLLEQVPLERYLAGVVPHEIGAGAPAAALAAQAVLARTWALRNLHRYEADGYHLCSDTQCQVYDDPRQAAPAVLRAIASTRHQVLSAGGQPLHAVYHASNGGVAAGFEEVWSGAPLPYLRSFVDGPTPLVAALPLPLSPAGLEKLLNGGSSAYGADHPVFRWRRQLSAAQIAAALRKQAPALGTPQRLKVLERGPSGRVLALEISSSGETVVLRLDAIRRTLRTLPSTLFRIRSVAPGLWSFEGGGFGHGAGLSQAGAIDLARRGWDVGRILQRYYPGSRLVPLTGLVQPLPALPPEQAP
jgi:SpoIID/LytB domain protein